MTSEDSDVMAQTDTRPGFRLPWSSDRADAGDPTGAATDASTEFGDAPATEEAEGTAMIEASPAATDTDATKPVADLHVVKDAEPEAPAAEAVDVVLEAPVDVEVAAKSAKSTKSTKFLADLTKAMQATAEAASAETLERFAGEAKAATEKVQASAADEITELRRSADEDVAAIREWSKGEIARIREETETRISTRKSYLEGELEDHAGVVERRVELISSAVAAFEAEMAAFCERLFAEGDPATFAAMAEQLPEPPSLDKPLTEAPAALIGTKAPANVATEAEPEAVVEAVVETVEAEVAEPEAVAEAPVAEAADVEPEATAEAPEAEIADAPEATAEVPEAEAEAEAEVTIQPDDPRIAMLGMSPDFAAAEAEAEMSAAESDAGGEAADEVQEIPTIAEEVVAARLAGLVPPSEAGEPSERLTTKVVVSGLVSVASIAGFKRGVARTQGVASVGVTSGPDGEFVFMVSHHPDVNLKEVIPALPGFNARVTGDSEDGFVVTARDPEAHD
jgi:hypothetical protein